MSYVLCVMQESVFRLLGLNAHARLPLQIWREVPSNKRCVSRICAHLSIVYATYTIDERAHMRETERT